MYYHGEKINVNVHVQNNNNGPGSTLSKVYTLCPLLSKNKDKRGLALDGQLKHEDTNLASSTTYTSLTQTMRENLGIVVQYKVKIRLLISGALGGELVAELPFTLTHAKPCDTPPAPTRHRESNGLTAPAANQDVADVDLIQLNYAADEEDDLVFEDFARMRVHTTADIDDAKLIQA
ncbi:putative beta-arrestin [Aphelenchoides avenae]|nr:putative beta-arrestin [Aphelenchus avenae]